MREEIVSCPYCGQRFLPAGKPAAPERKPPEEPGEDKRHAKNLVEGEFYRELDSDGRLFAIVQELGHYCRFYFDGKGGQARVLRILSQRAEISQKDLTERLGIRPGSASEVLGKLEHAGLISRTPDKTDKRTVTVRLTAAGRDHVNGFERDREARIHALFSELSDEDKATLLSLMETLYAAWRRTGRERERTHRA